MALVPPIPLCLLPSPIRPSWTVSSWEPFCLLWFYYSIEEERLHSIVVMRRLGSLRCFFSSPRPDHELLAVGPLDGRYRGQVSELSNYFSEYALIKYRTKVELKWLIYMSQNGMIKKSHHYKPSELQQYLNNILDSFDLKNAQRVKEIEAQTNHDVKAVEYFVKEELDRSTSLRSVKEYVHFCCTSEDINNLAYAMILTEAKDQILRKHQLELLETMIKLCEREAGTVMLSRTHGQSATPTTLGKEIANFTYRFGKVVKTLQSHKFQGKFNGAVGNFNAHIFAYPEFSWHRISKDFVNKLDLEYNPYTTQIEPHDSIATFSNSLALSNTILLGMSRDFWQYISLGYFQQKTRASEVGSSTMPHKINPIDFENSEGNLGLANSLLTHFAAKLPISRLQRDLSDSTVLRNQGLALGYTILSYKSLMKGLGKLEVNRETITDQINDSYEVVSEAVQTLLRKHGYKDPYEKLKELTRGKKFTKKSLKQLIASLSSEGLSEDDLESLHLLEPYNYTGNAKQMALEIRKHLEL